MLLDGVRGSTLALAECGHCCFIGRFEGDDQPAVPCPNCGMAGCRMIFPGVTILRTLDLLFPAQRAIEAAFMTREADQRGDCARALDRDVSESAMRRLRADLNREYRQSRTFDALQERIANFFRCDEQAALSVLRTLVRSDELDTSADPAFVAILAVCVVEALLVDSIDRAHRTHAGAGLLPSARRKLSLFKRRYESFKELTGHEYRQATEGVDPQWWSKWSRVQDRRNKFVHGNPFAIGPETSRVACSVASQAVGIHALLNNRYALRPGSTEQKGGRAPETLGGSTPGPDHSRGSREG